MMKNVKIWSLLLAFYAIIGIVGCKSDKDKQYEDIVSIEKALFGDRTALNDSLARIYLNKSEQYLNTYKKDEHSAELLFKTGEVLNGLQSYSYAIRKFQDLYALYPNDPKAPESVFLCAFIYDTHLQKYEDAARYYRLFLRKYPKHPLAKDAQNSLDNIGKTPEEMVKEFEKLDHSN